MTAISLDGAALSAQMREQLAEDTEKLSADGITPGLGTLLVGDDPASHTYVAAKHRACAEVGIASIERTLPETATTEMVLEAVAELNANPDCDAFIVQLPLPSQCDEERVLLAVNPDKDADGLHPVNLGRLVMGADGPLPCTPHGIQQLLAHYEVPIEGKHVVVIGRGLTIGRPLALLMAMKRPNANAAVTVVHTGVPDLADHVRRGDIVVSAAGRPGLVTPDMVKPGAAVVGGGITREGKKILSDVADEVADVAGWMTPRLGGVGPMTVVMLLANTVAAARNRSV